jgi:hypothetical protein
MKRQTYDDKLLTDYLLGSLSEEEAERLDELSFTDDELAARLQVVENDLVDAYARGEMTGATLERFKSHYLASPMRREKAAFARGFQDLLRQSVTTEREQRSFGETSAARELASHKGFLHRFFFPTRSAVQWGLAAAALVVLLLSGWLAFDNLRLRDQMNQARAEREELQRRERELQTELADQRSGDSEKEQELAALRERLAELERQLDKQPGAKSETEPERAAPNTVAFTLAPQMRGASQPATVTIPADAEYVAFTLELEPNDFASYCAELKARPGDEVVWRSARLKAKAAGGGHRIAVTVRAALLKSGMYNLESYGVSPTGAAEIISSYPIRVVKQ